VTSAIPLALSRQDVADYVSALFLLYAILIMLNVLIAWMPRMPFYSRWFRGVLDFITETTDPYLNVFRRVVPSFGAGGVAISLAPIVALVVLFAVEAVVVALIRG
jgi:YggT family protein